MENVKTRLGNLMVQPVEHVSFPSYDVHTTHQTQFCITRCDVAIIIFILYRKITNFVV